MNSAVGVLGVGFAKVSGCLFGFAVIRDSLKQHLDTLNLAKTCRTRFQAASMPNRVC